MINRFSSRREPLDASFLNKRLEGAKSYDRIAGYFSSSILEVAGEALDSVEGKVRVVCNSQLEAEDVKTAQAALAAIRKEWCAEEPEKMGAESRGRFSRLYEYLKSGKLQVRVLPDYAFWLIHGKAGVITKSDGTKTAFMGSINETFSAWKLNYELIWEDDSPEAINWVQEEFGSCPQIIDLILYIFESIIIGGIGITSELDFSQFFCWNKDCPDYGINNQGNIVLKVRYGKNNHALLKCKTCKKCFSETRGTVFFQLNTPEEEILRTVATIPEKGGIRGLARATGHSKNTISRWLDIAGTHSKEVTTYFLTNLNLKRVEVDEIWSYIKKAKKM